MLEQQHDKILKLQKEVLKRRWQTKVGCHVSRRPHERMLFALTCKRGGVQAACRLISYWQHCHGALPFGACVNLTSAAAGQEQIVQCLQH